MKKLVVLFLLLSSLAVEAQENTPNAKPKWIIGFGVNFIDNTANNKQFLNFSNKLDYLPSVSKVSFERLMSEQFSLEGSMVINKLSANKIQNGSTINEDQDYFGLDLNGKFYFGKEFIKWSAFDPYLVAGFGLNKVGDNTGQSSNLGLGFNFWFNPNIGVRMQSQGKFSFNQIINLNNHIQHSAEIVFKF
jgi:hypothetical protein